MNPLVRPPTTVKELAFEFRCFGSADRHFAGKWPVAIVLPHKVELRTLM